MRARTKASGVDQHAVGTGKSSGLSVGGDLLADELYTARCEHLGNPWEVARRTDGDGLEAHAALEPRRKLVRAQHSELRAR